MTSIVDRLLTDPPAIHGDEESGQERLTHGLSVPALRFIAETVRPGHRTLETGAGFSTIVFASVGATHTTVMPNAFEVDRIKAYCAANQIDDGNVTFQVQPSERVLPVLDDDPLDLVLIDGSHSFPHTYIDWFYTAHRLNVGGYLLLDDVHIWTGRQLRDFMRADPAWEFVTEYLGRTSLFRKVAATDPDVLWTDQPVVVKRSGLGNRGRAMQAISMLRHGQTDELRKLARGMIGR